MKFFGKQLKRKKYFFKYLSKTSIVSILKIEFDKVKKRKEKMFIKLIRK